MELIQVIKALSDETRLRILNLLQNRELCVCELETLLDINQSNASRHLNRLVNARIISFDKKAQYVYYKINEDALKEFDFITKILDDELMKVEKCRQDLDRLEEYQKSSLTCDDLKDGKACFKK